MPVTEQMDRRTFLQNLRQSGLLSAAELADLEVRLPDTDHARTIARACLKMGALTRFQAERLLAGRTAGFILDQYKILEEIGRGGMGRVYKAEHRTMHRMVALKILAPHLFRTQRAQDLFQREICAIARLQHPNIVTAFDANKTGDRFYLVLEYVDGPNLDQLVRRQGPLNVGQACDFVRQIAHGLQCAHALGMVHRDIKPANILVQQRGVEGENSPGLVKISDFGLARLQEADAGDDLAGTILTRPNTVMGTPDFLSPEQARCLHNTDIRSDLYSLGCTFHFLLTGEVPFYGGTAMEKLIRQNTEEPPPIDQVRTDVPAEVLAVIRKLMAKQPEQRFQTPAELAAALEPFSVSGPTPWDPLRPIASVDEELSFTPTDGTSPSGLRPTLSPSGLRVNTVAVQGDATPTPLESGARSDEEGAASRTWLYGTAGLVAAAAALAALAVRWLL